MSLFSALAAASAALLAPPAFARGPHKAENHSKSGQPDQTSGHALSEKAVKKLQRRLIQTGYLQTGRLAASGKWDKKTAQAVTLFQKDYGLTANGKPDSATLKALNLQTGQGNSG